MRGQIQDEGHSAATAPRLLIPALLAAVLAATPGLAQQTQVPGGGAVAGTTTSNNANDAADNDDADLASTGVAGLAGYPGRGFKLRGSFDSRYETNLSRLAVADDGLRLRPQVRGEYGLGTGRLGLFVTGNYGRDIFVGNQRFNGANRYLVGGGVSADLARCRLDAGASYRRSLVLFSDVIQFGGFEQQTTQYGTNLACRLGSAITVRGGVTRAELEVVRGGTNAINSERWTYTAGLGLNMRALGQVSLDGSLSDIDLTGRQVLTPTGLENDGLRQRSLRLGLQRQLGSRITVTLGGSLLDTAPKNPFNVIIVDGLPQVVDRTSFKGAGYDAALNLRLSPRLNLTASASRNVNANGFVGAQFQVIDVMDFRGSYDLGTRFTVSAGMSFRQSKFRGTVVTSLEPQRRVEDDFYRYYAQLSGKLGQRLTFALSVNHNERRSNPSVFNFSSTGVGLNLGMQFGRGAR